MTTSSIEDEISDAR